MVKINGPYHTPCPKTVRQVSGFLKDEAALTSPNTSQFAGRLERTCGSKPNSRWTAAGLEPKSFSTQAGAFIFLHTQIQNIFHHLILKLSLINKSPNLAAYLVVLLDYLSSWYWHQSNAFSPLYMLYYVIIVLCCT